MKNRLLLLILFGVSHGLAQSDSTEVPIHPVFAPRVRTLAIEGSTYWFYYKGLGGTADFDFVHYTDANLTGAGFRLSYQEYRKGATFSFDKRTKEEVIVGRSACARVTLSVGDTRSDALLGVSTGDPQLGTPDAQVVFGVDMHAIVVKPVAAIFGRVMGSPNGIWIQFGVSVGYMN